MTSELTIPLTAEELFDCIYDGDWPYKVRRNKCKEKQWEVFHHSKKDVVSPVVDASYYAGQDADEHAYALNKALLLAVIGSEYPEPAEEQRT